MLAGRPSASVRGTAPAVVVERNTDTAVLEGFAEAQLDALKAVIDRLPPRTSNEYETYIRSVIGQCVKAELLAANSWRVAVNAGAAADGPLLGHLRALEATRTRLHRFPGHRQQGQGDHRPQPGTGGPGRDGGSG